MTDETDELEGVPPEAIAVVATINLPGLRQGETGMADPSDPYVADCLRARYVVPVDDEI